MLTVTTVTPTVMKVMLTVMTVKWLNVFFPGYVHKISCWILLQANHLPYSLIFCRYPDDVTLKLSIRMLNEKQKYRRGQLKTNMRQAAMREQEKEKNPEQYREKNKKSCQEYHKRKKKWVFILLFFCYSMWFISSEIIKYLFKNFCTDRETTHIENNNLKRVMNAMKMRIYQENLSGQKKEFYLKKERMWQAKIRLEKKCET